MENKLKEGQLLFLSDTSECVISKVGIKYFYLTNMRGCKFDKDTLRSVDPVRSVQLFLTKEEPATKRDIENLYSKIRQKFNNHYTGQASKISLNKLKQISEILDDEEANISLC